MWGGKGGFSPPPGDSVGAVRVGAVSVRMGGLCGGGGLAGTPLVPAVLAGWDSRSVGWRDARRWVCLCNARAMLVQRSCMGTRSKPPCLSRGDPQPCPPTNSPLSCTPKICGHSGGHNAPKGKVRMLSPRCYPGDPVLSRYSNGDPTKGKGTGMGTGDTRLGTEGQGQQFTPQKIQ